MQRCILHVDLDAFFCSVEELRDPSLSGTPFVVGGTPQGRGVVSSASYPARKFGVRNAMSTARALKLCPQLQIIHGHYELYGQYSQRVMTLLRDYGRVMEQISIDEAFLDVTDLHQEPRELGSEVQTRVRSEVGLPASVGIATSKLVAKIASGRAKPNGVLVVNEGDEAVFLAPMKVEELWGIGAATAARLNEMGIFTIGQLAQSEPARLRSIFGMHTEHALERARGIDRSPVSDAHDTKSISEERTFTRDLSARESLRGVLLSLSDQVAERLRAEELYARTVQLKLRWPDFTTITRQTTLPVATQLGSEIFMAVEAMWQNVWREGKRVRLLGVGVSELSPYANQLPLFDNEQREQRLTLAHVTDSLRAKYGEKIIERASLKKKRS